MRRKYQINNLPHLKKRRKKFRNHPTDAEYQLWLMLKGRKLNGYKFRRQHSVGEYVLDFYCATHRLAVELDGAFHFTAAGRKHDERRKQFLEDQEIKVIRFENYHVFIRPRLVLDSILESLSRRKSVFRRKSM